MELTLKKSTKRFSKYHTELFTNLVHKWYIPFANDD